MNYKHLLRIPTCPHNLYLKIKDIYFSGKEMCGKWCSLLVAVRCVSTYYIILIPNSNNRIMIKVIKNIKITYNNKFVQVKSTKIIKTKIGKESFLKEIVVMDETHPKLVVKIWDKELSEIATQWTPKKTSNKYMIIKLI